jgi:hypothetical protein
MSHYQDNERGRIAVSRLNASNADAWRGARHASKDIARLDVRCALAVSGITSKWPLARWKMAVATLTKGPATQPIQNRFQ